jgi:hypothetical protein
MKVVDPTGVVPVLAEAEGSWSLDMRGKTLGVLWNGKPNADNLFRVMERRLTEQFGVADTIWVDKLAMARGPALPASEEMFDKLSSGAIAVLSGSGD